ncbi:hypothetical protein HPB51_017017 [Rhipicephalus microplus]|uniref:Platelet-derived growth factor (PDGF) family profile domain-containing protein n=1 Tax=Rhipicephalus microplus TaxID=6941 RepID=A0A9J6F4W6_RHIMP|nr:hypothetical protein HPB51_017017 [Rhipicephalus microplus]
MWPDGIERVREHVQCVAFSAVLWRPLAAAAGAGSSASVPNPEPGTCLPSKQLVEFPKPTDPSIILWPPCTRVPRCGGCCPSTILKCAPTKTSNVTFKVIKAQYPEPGASKFNFVGHEIVTLEKHDKCSCECKERPADCNALQQYSECRCVCRNNNEMLSCHGPGVVWDPRDCRCKCRDYAECSTGFYYNTRTCRCMLAFLHARLPVEVPSIERGSNGTALFSSFFLFSKPLRSFEIQPVIKAQYPEPGASKFNFVGHEIVTLEKHDKCSCECKERPTDCNALQQYSECRCVCRNNNEMLSCNGPSVVWDPRDCRCKCRDYAECSTGFYYNTRTCSVPPTATMAQWHNGGMLAQLWHQLAQHSTILNRASKLMNESTHECEQLGRSRIASRIRQPLPRLYAPYTDNRENLQSRSYRNLDLIVGDDYSRPYTDSEHAPTVRPRPVDQDDLAHFVGGRSLALEDDAPDAAEFDGVTSAVPRAETE